MKTNLKKSLFVGMAALGFVAAAGAVNANQASAKSYAKVESNKTLKTDYTTRNFTSNGSAALYTKAGTLKGAKVVATKTTLKNMGESKSSKNYFRAYALAKTNRGSYYMKVVSFDQKYRGWIYVGKTDPTNDYSLVAGGLKQAATTTKAALPASTTVKLAKAGKTNVVWDNPYMTQYKAKKVVKDMTDYANDTFTVSDSVTKTKEGTPYYYVTSAQHPEVKGWIFADAVTPVNGAKVTVNLVDAITGKTVKTVELNDTKAIPNAVSATSFVGSQTATLATAADGYSFALINSADQAANNAAIASAKYNTTITLKVAPSQVINANQVLVQYIDAKTGTKVGEEIVTNDAISSDGSTWVDKDKNAKPQTAGDFLTAKLAQPVTVNGKSYKVNVANEAAAINAAKYGSIVKINVALNY